MPSTHLSLHYHLVFGTKDHATVIAPAWRGDLHAFMGGIVRTLGGVPEAVGGVSDHVHLLVGLRATHCLADVLRELKAVSSRWVHETPGARVFAWQEGYGAFSINESQKQTVINYIDGQAEHHKKWSFEQEFMTLLKKSGMEYDPRFVFG